MLYSSLLLDGCGKISQRPLNRRCHPLWQRRPLVAVATKLEATIFKYKFIPFPTRHCSLHYSSPRSPLR